MKSKTALFKFLSNHFNKPGVSLETAGVSDETYGRKSCIYLWDIAGIWKIGRNEFEQLLKDNGFIVNTKYGRNMARYGMKDYDATEVTVSYFKGYHWDE